MICYTRNFEDVILQRVFSDVPNGCYIDVGAYKPIKDSNTYALYQKGWRGIAIEPQPYQALWQEARPEDLLLSAAVGAEPGFLELKIYGDSLQNTTGAPETIALWERHNVKPTSVIRAPVLTLNQVIGQHLAGRPIHLLSIDVEGSERDVLKGLNLSTHRPWVIVVEATVPGLPHPSHHAWEPDLLSANYLMTYFDGANRFYLAGEQRNLLGKFATPPSVWDNFVTARELDLKARIEELEEQLRALQQ